MNDPPAFLKKAGDMMVHFVDGFIEFDKPLIAMVNGPGNFSRNFLWNFDVMLTNFGHLS